MIESLIDDVLDFGWELLVVGLFVFVATCIAIWLFDDDDDVEDDGCTN